ncbi:hypothetical protein BN159_4456 [Streptomyces davaonensis JCM 4913]|uniref:Ribbon-helix-helix protein CopG domain-containing protein n=1 Tax=Streptomyces davaonensis (strain DSM 101723 / JCM 4913 / KCC S-0913 / 768) TaxID=1214101 RepID=K4R709_STRDJ|nr:hypothetical protein [Streptomyces davaonensis]CCK28835.1 hypothetical protein BN159_4456 [Streptomyces davaonensis JCM 4913]
MTLHAVEITLTRSVDAVELRAAQEDSSLPMAAAGDRRRLVILVSAKNERQAMRKIWKRLEDALPIDVLCSLFPGADGKYLMSIPMSDATHERIRERAVAEGKTPEEYLQEAIAQALARDRSARQAQLACALNELLRTYSPEEITGAAARRIDA